MELSPFSKLELSPFCFFPEQEPNQNEYHRSHPTQRVSSPSVALLELSPNGLYCPPGDFYLDPWTPVSRAVISHAHSDHARWGSESYLTHSLTAPFLQHRLGADISVRGIEYGE